MAQKPMLRAEVYARAWRASQYVKRAGLHPQHHFNVSVRLNQKAIDWILRSVVDNRRPLATAKSKNTCHNESRFAAGNGLGTGLGTTIRNVRKSL